MIYLDHNATTPVLPEVVEAMLPWLTTNWGNPSSIHGQGRAARRAVEDARGKVAEFVGSEPDQVIFTSGATEANNAAIHSVILRDPTKRHIVTSAVEHSAVLAYCDYLERHHDIEVTRLPVDEYGRLPKEVVAAAIRPDTALVSLIWANNETGVIWPVEEFASICTERGIPFHTDSVQAVGKIPVDFAGCGADFLSISGHKFGAPKGIGALIIRNAETFHPFQHGGNQENGHRGGTENVSHIVALGAAARLALERGANTWSAVAALRDDLEKQIFQRVPGALVNGSGSSRLPNTSNLNLPGIDGDALVTFLDQHGICISSGSACMESAITPSHVILAMTSSHDRASESIRVSLGFDTTEEKIEELFRSLNLFISMVT